MPKGPCKGCDGGKKPPPTGKCKGCGGRGTTTRIGLRGTSGRGR